MVTITCVARASCPLSRERPAPASARAGCPRPSGRDARATKTVRHYILQSSISPQSDNCQTATYTHLWPAAIVGACQAIQPRTAYHARKTPRKTELIWQIVVAKRRFSAKLVAVRRKCPNLRHKCPTFFRASCPRFVCFHIHSGFVRIFSNIFFASLPEIGHGGGDSGLRRGSLGGVGGR
jgi:hypothetical protein